MRRRRLTWRQRAGVFTMGAMLLNVNYCLPDDYFARFGEAGRAAILDAFAEAVFTTVIDALFPQVDGDVDVDTTNGNGT